MNLAQIKSQINIPSLQLNPSKDKDNNPDGWYRHWENDTRTAVSLHKDTVEAIKADPELNSLGLQSEKRAGAKGEYTAYRIVAYTPAEIVL